MHQQIRANLEGYLAGALSAGERQSLEAHMAACGACRAELEVMAESAQALRHLRAPADLDTDLGPGFYARVMERIDRERPMPFWAPLLDPVFGRRLVFACLMLLAVLGTWVVVSDPMAYPERHRPEAMLAGRRTAPLKAPPRMMQNLERNRQVVLATLVTAD